MTEEKVKVKVGTIVRTIVLVLALINIVLTSTGHSPIPISDETVNAVVSNIFNVVVVIWAWWKNNSFTKAAIKADEYMKELKSEVQTEE